MYQEWNGGPCQESWHSRHREGSKEEQGQREKVKTENVVQYGRRRGI